MAALKNDITASRARDLFSVDADGNLVWRAAKGCRKAGEVAGSLKKSGYIELSIDGSTYRAHRVVWLVTHGRWPCALIDHINFNKSDNRPENLREASYSESTWHRNMPKGWQGLKGVTLHKSGKYQAQIGFNRRTKYLGLFDTAQQAAAEYQRASKELHGSFGVGS